MWDLPAVRDAEECPGGAEIAVRFLDLAVIGGADLRQ